VRAPDDTWAAREEQRLSSGQVEALMPYGRELRLEEGDLLFDEKSAVDSFYVVLEGRVNISRLDGAEETSLVEHGAGEFTGGLAVLTGRTSIHRARAASSCRVLEIDSETFRRLAVEVPDVADVFVSGLARRMRQTQRAFRQQEKLAALGKLSAGLTHELNNPAAAARRAAEELGHAVLQAQLAALRHDERFSEKERSVLVAVQSETVAEVAPLDPLALGDAEDGLTDWLEERGVEEAWEFAPALVAAGIGTDCLEALANTLEEKSLTAGLGWLAMTTELVNLAGEIGTSVGRISELVGAMKDYTYMDRAAAGEVNIIAGLENTLTILGHKLKGVSVRREFEEDLPKIQGNGGELNQVWTNLLDNAIGAVDGRGNITVEAFVEAEHVVVEVVDDGPGIPRGARGRVFEPFYTTKEVGTGTGLGLDIVRRVVDAHGGEVSFRSQPGETRFTVRLPVDTRQNGG